MHPEYYSPSSSGDSPQLSLSLSLFSGVELTRAIVGGELQGEKGDPEKRLCGISRGLMGGVENNGKGTERERERAVVPCDFILAAAWPQHI